MSVLEALESRDSSGRFMAGNSYARGHGNPHAARVNELRKSILATVSPGDVADVMRALLVEARSGNVLACREILDRTVGKPLETDLVERLDQLEQILDVPAGSFA